MTFRVYIQVVSTTKGSVAEGALNRDEEVSTFNVLVHVCGFVTEVITVGARPASLLISGENLDPNTCVHFKNLIRLIKGPQLQMSIKEV